MHTTLGIIGIAALATAAGSVQADGDCHVPMADWQPRATVTRLAEERGWTIRRINIDDGCYEIGGQDSQGRSIEVTVHPVTLTVLKLEYEADDGPSGDTRDED